jgi:hypothetical protein
VWEAITGSSYTVPLGQGLTWTLLGLTPTTSASTDPFFVPSTAPLTGPTLDFTLADTGEVAVAHTTDASPGAGVGSVLADAAVRNAAG